MPIFEKQIDPATNAIIAGTTQVLEILKPICTIPFSKKKVDELSPYFTSPLSLIVIDRSGKKYSCNSLEEFRDLDYQELVNLKTGFTDYMRTKRQDQLKIGGVK